MKQNLLQSATTAAATGIVSEHLLAQTRGSDGAPRSNPHRDAIATSWNTTKDPVELADMAEVMGRIEFGGPGEIVFALLLSYAQHYPPYEKQLIQNAVKIARSGNPKSRDAVVLRQHLRNALKMNMISMAWIPLNAAYRICSAIELDSAAAHIRSFAGMENSKTYPFNQKYVADMFHSKMPPVTTSEFYAKVNKMRGKAASLIRAAAGVRANPRRKRSRR